jgi:hypothetical protein
MTEQVLMNILRPVGVAVHGRRDLCDNFRDVEGMAARALCAPVIGYFVWAKRDIRS